MIETNIIETQSIQSKIYTIRGQKVMLDSDMASLYGVETKTLNQSIKRNINRFPIHYMFQLTQSEYDDLRSQNVTSKKGSGGRRYLPNVFTEPGVAMVVLSHLKRKFQKSLKTDRNVRDI